MISNEEIEAADVVLANMILNDPRDFSKDFTHWLREDQKSRNHKRFEKIINDDTKESYGRVHGFLLTEGYVGRVEYENEAKYLTKKGDIAKRKGGHLQYLKYEKWIRYLNVFKGIIAYIFIPIMIAFTLYYTICLWKIEYSPKKHNDTPQIAAPCK